MHDLARRASVRLTVLVAATLLVVTACLPYNQQESYVYDQTNALRGSSGIAHVAPMDELTTRARTWARTLAARGQLAHSDLNQIGVAWTAAAENVGVSNSAEDVYRLLVNSPGHRTNMVNPKFTHTGVGTARGKDGRIYVVQLFIRR